MKKETFSASMIARLFLFFSPTKAIFSFLYWRIGDNLKSTKMLMPNNKAGKEETYIDLGIVFQKSSDFHKAIEYNECHLQTAKEVGDKAGEGRAYENLGNAYHSLGDFQKAIQYHERHLQIAKQVGDKAGQGGAYGNLGNAYHS